MGDPVVLREEDVGRIGEYVKPWLREIVSQMAPSSEFGGISAQLFERMVRVEEELKSQREMMDERFGLMVRRFDDQREATDRRFDDQRQFLAERFEAMDKRFHDQREANAKRFDDQREILTDRFRASDKRFDDHLGYLSDRFEAVDQRFEALTGQMNRRFTTLTWMIGISFTVIATLSTIFAIIA